MGKEKYYKLNKIYDLNWDIDLSNYIIAVSTFGGPIALTIDHSNPESKGLDNNILIPAVKISP